VTTLTIIETHDVRKDVGRGFFMGLVILEVNVFAFEGAKETLHRGIVIAVACAAHAGLHPLIDQELLVGPSSILAAPIRMVEQSTERWPVLHRHVEGLLYQAALQRGGEGPADNFARE